VRLLTENLGNRYSARLMHNWVEVAYVVFGISGLELEIEFPSDWHEEQRGWLRIGLGLVKFAISFPWPWVVPDNMQCSGPTYGFTFFGRSVHVHYGKDKYVIWDMPWAWEMVRYQVVTAENKLIEPLPLDYPKSGPGIAVDDRWVNTYPYEYLRNNGAVQKCMATIYIWEREWRWKLFQWFPYFGKINRSIDITFSTEMGEKSGSWKGGVTGCSYEMRKNETPYKTLMRMQKERKL